MSGTAPSDGEGRVDTEIRVGSNANPPVPSGASVPNTNPGSSTFAHPDQALRSSYRVPLVVLTDSNHPDWKRSLNYHLGELNVTHALSNDMPGTWEDVRAFKVLMDSLDEEGRYKVENAGSTYQAY